VQIGNRVPAVKQGSASRPVKGAQHLQQRRFSATAWTGDGKEFTLRDAKVNPSQSMHLTVIKVFRDPYGLEYVSQGFGSCGVQCRRRMTRRIVRGINRILEYFPLLFPFRCEFLALFFSAQIGFQIF
jgi:hypothetical protein